MAPFAARRLRSCQYLTGPDEAGRNGTGSRSDSARVTPWRVRPMTTLRCTARSYPAKRDLSRPPSPLHMPGLSGWRVWTCRLQAARKGLRGGCRALFPEAGAATKAAAGHR